MEEISDMEDQEDQREGGRKRLALLSGAVDEFADGLEPSMQILLLAVGHLPGPRHAASSAQTQRCGRKDGGKEANTGVKTGCMPLYQGIRCLDYAGTGRHRRSPHAKSLPPGGRLDSQTQPSKSRWPGMPRCSEACAPANSTCKHYHHYQVTRIEQSVRSRKEGKLTRSVPIQTTELAIQRVLLRTFEPPKSTQGLNSIGCL